VPLKQIHHALSALMLVLLELILYRKVVRLWWTFDDPNLLHTIVPARFAEPFFNGALWPQQLFTPLLMTAFQSELILFDAEPRRWYVMQLALACIAALAFYAAALTFLDYVPALAAATLFAAGPPLCSVVTQLSTVHYLLAITLGALAIIAYVAAIRRSSLLLAAFSVLLYLGAMLAKEVAVPLPLLLLALPVGDLRSRARMTIGHWIALAGYFAWRRAVIGTFFGAYGWVIAPHEWPALLAMLPWRVVTAAGGANRWLGVPLMAIMAAVILYAAARNRRTVLLLSVAVVVVISPLVPLAKEVNRRYVLIPWLAFAMAFAASAMSIRDKRLRVALLAFVTLLAVAANRQEWGREFVARQRMSDELRCFFEMPPSGLLRIPTSPPAVMRELNWVKLVYLGRPAGASWFFDDIYLCSHPSAGKRVWEFDPKVLTVVEITGKMDEIAKRHCGSIRGSVPLSVHFHFDRPALHWEFGPYEQGSYSAIIADGFEVYHVPRREALYVPGVTALALRVRYDSPQGWTTYSPEMMLDFQKQTDFHWRR
jgi:hypothetical protein